MKERVISLVSAFVVCLAVQLVIVGGASADSTHKFLYAFNTPPGSQPQPTAVDNEGNVYVYNDGPNTVSKYDAEGNPVNFSALGSNTIDGKGFGEDCPATPDDCDRVPENGFFAAAPYGNGLHGVVAVDTSSGPTHGYLYVTNPGGGPFDPLAVTTGSVEIFDASGTFLGQIDRSVDGPTETYAGGGEVNVDNNGHIYLWVRNFGVIDEFVPIDGNPAHNTFRGQIRPLTLSGVGVAEPTDGIGDNPYSYTTTAGGESFKWAYEEYTARRPGVGIKSFAHPVPYPPDDPIFENGGTDAEANSAFDQVSMDPSTDDVYIMNETYGRIREWSPDNDPIGPLFGPPYTGEVRGLAIDGSHGPNRGTIYTQGSGNNRDQIAVFSPPVPLPDVVYGPRSVGHTTAHITASIELAGGPEITKCELEWGTTIGYRGTPAYERKSVPCSPAVPYGTDQQVSIDLSKIPVEQDFHYRLAAETANGRELGRNRNGRTAAVLDVETEAATNLTPQTATLNGSLNPDGMSTAYHFDYGVDPDYGLSTVDQSAGSGSGSEMLPGKELADLQPGRIYHYRLVATNELGTTRGPDRTFVTPTSPRIFAQRTRNLTETSVDLQAKVNPLGFDTSYQFEYGTGATYGSTSGAGTLTASDEPQDVETHLAELMPGVTYHFRIVATNQWGTARSPDTTFSFFPPDCPNAHIRQQTSANYLPDCRAYELVSPENANGTQIIPGDSMSQWFNGTGGGGSAYGQNITYEQYSQDYAGLASKPSRFSFFASGSGMEGAEVPNTIGDLYVSTRTDHGWKSAYPGVRGDEYFGGSHPQCSLKLDECLEFPILGSPGTEEPRQDNAPIAADATTGRSLGRLPSNYATIPDQGEFTGWGQASGDFSHYVFSSLDRLFAVGGATTEPGSVYDNDLETDTVEIVSRLPNGEPIPSEPGAAEHEDYGAQFEEFVNHDYLEVPAVSTDGSHILIGARIGARCESASREERCGGEDREMHLYMRVNDAMTYDVSQGHAVFLLGMTDTGSAVIFSSREPLVAEDTDTSTDLYRWNENTNDLVLLSQGNGQGDSDDCAAGWTEQCDVQPMSTCTTAWTYSCNYNHFEDNNSNQLPDDPHPFMSRRPEVDSGIARKSGDVLFESPEQLDPTNPGVPGQRNLYEYRNGDVHYVATFDPGSGTERFDISTDGSHVAFLTDSRLTAYDNTSTGEVLCDVTFNLTAGTLNTPCDEMYSYDAETGDLRCVSCNPTGEPPMGDVTASASGPFISDDGRTFFNTPDALVPEDTNGLIDVYEFADGRPQLISSGTSNQDLFGGFINAVVLGYVFPPEHVGLEAVSADGVDVYFSTFDTLVPQDRNGEFVKMYDARTNGGIPFTPPDLPCPAADECHGANSEPPQEPGLGSAAALNTETVSRKKSSKGHRARRKQHRGRHHKKQRNKRHHSRRGGTDRG
jgi:hypothetical protein